MEKQPIALLILALDSDHESIFQVTVISHMYYRSALQEALGLGRILLKNDSEVVRVEVHNERDFKAGQDKALAVLAHDDIFYGKQDSQRSFGKSLSSIARRLVQEFFR